MSGKTNRCALQSDVSKGQEQKWKFNFKLEGEKIIVGTRPQENNALSMIWSFGAEQYQDSIQIVAVNKQ